MCVLILITVSLCSPDSEGLNTIVGRANILCSVYVWYHSADVYECLLELHTDVV